MARRDGIRASDSDRETVGERLRKAAHEGRLTTDELETRLAAAFRAQTYGDLDAVTADLPVPRLAIAGQRSRTSATRRRLSTTSPALLAVGAVAAIVVIAVAVALLVLAATVWIGWLVLAWLFFRRAPRRPPLPPRYLYARQYRRAAPVRRHHGCAGGSTPWL